MNSLDKFFGPPSKDKFARRMMAAIRKAGENAPLHYDPKQFRLYREGDGKNEMNLVNAYNEYCAAPKDKKEIVFRNFVRTWFCYRREIPTEFEDVKHDLLPGVRNRLFFELTVMEWRAKAEEGAKFDWPFRVLADCLGVGLVYDLPESMVQVQQHALEEWKSPLTRRSRLLARICGRSVRGAWSPWDQGFGCRPGETTMIPLECCFRISSTVMKSPAIQSSWSPTAIPSFWPVPRTRRPLRSWW